jgi:hypothetical protein
MFAAPLEGWKWMEITKQRTREDWAKEMKKLVDKDFPEAEKIVLVMDNLNTHSIGSLYETYPAERSGTDKGEIGDSLQVGFSSEEIRGNPEEPRHQD